jgi:glycosyltransferase involved in cell wall biosynthesis
MILKVLYLFAGERKKIETQWLAGEMPDSFLVGFNYLKELGIEPSYSENSFLNFIRKKNFNLTNLFLLPFLHSYDIVFSGASLSLPFVAKVILRFKKPKFIWYNTFFTNALKRNRSHRIRLWMFRKTIASLDAIICPSTAQREFLIEEGFDPKKIFFVSNGVDIDFMLRNASRPTEASSSEKPFILSVGKDMGRDYKTLVQAAKELPIELKIAALPRNLKNIILPSNVTVLGFVPFLDLLELYKKALFIVVSTKSESHLDASDCSGQYVLLDAMAMGKAVIATERQTLGDYLQNEKEGIVVPAQDPVKLHEAIQKLLAHPDITREMGQQGQEKAKKFFTTKRLAGDLAKIFNHVFTL